MPWNGSGTAQVTDGTFTGTAIWTAEKNASQLVTAAHFDSFSADLCSMLNNCYTLDGQTVGSQIKMLQGISATQGVIYSGSNILAMIFGTDGFANSFLCGGGNTTVGQTYQNICIGPLAGTSLSTGQNNIFIGNSAGSASTDGGNNTIVGVQSGNSGTFDAASNTLIGASVGQQITTGGANTIIGAGSGAGLSTGSKNIALGFNLTFVDNTASGQINIACTIFGTGCTGTFSSPGTGKIGINSNAPTYELECGTGDFGIKTAGKTIRIKEGSNAKMGSAALVAGSKVVSTTAVTANSRIFVTSQTDGGSPGFLRVSTRTAGTSFTVTSSSGTDTSTFAWFIVEPY